MIIILCLLARIVQSVNLKLSILTVQIVLYFTIINKTSQPRGYRAASAVKTRGNHAVAGLSLFILSSYCHVDNMKSEIHSQSLKFLISKNITLLPNIQVPTANVCYNSAINTDVAALL